MSPILDLHENREIRTKSMLLGHVRLGITDARGYPVQTDTFVFTSADRARLEPLARDLGGHIEPYEPHGGLSEDRHRLVSETDAFTALFPFSWLEGNVEQSWELWTGGAQLLRRCDGYTAALVDVHEETGEWTEETHACICAAQGTRECRPTTRVRLLLPQTGLGLWELTTPSKIAAIHLWDQARFVAEVAKDRMNHVPVRLVYAPRKIRYFDEKAGKRKSTTKRVVSLSVAGDAASALAALGTSEDQGLLAAVRAVLDEPRTKALPEPSPEAAPAANLGVGEPEGGSTAPPSEAGDGLATPEQWAASEALGMSGAVVLRRARALFADDPPKTKAQVTRAQLAAVLDEKMGAKA